MRFGVAGLEELFPVVEVLERPVGVGAGATIHGLAFDGHAAPPKRLQTGCRRGQNPPRGRAKGSALPEIVGTFDGDLPPRTTSRRVPPARWILVGPVRRGGVYQKVLSAVNTKCRRIGIKYKCILSKA